MYGVVQVRSPAVFVVPVTDAGEVVLVAVDRYAIGMTSWEVPAGGTDGEEPVVAAARELREEAGLAARELVDLGPVHSLNGVADAPGRVFLRDRSASPWPGPSRRPRASSRPVRFRPQQLITMLGAGEITDNETLGAVLLALVRLGRVR